jgi:hypothetical protein
MNMCCIWGVYPNKDSIVQEERIHRNEDFIRKDVINVNLGGVAICAKRRKENIYPIFLF